MKSFVLLITIIGFIACNETSKKSVNAQSVPSAKNFKPFNEIQTRLIHGQTIYVPVYSSIYNRFEGDLLHLTAILSIRNTSNKNPIIITKITYYDTNGELIKELIPKPFSLGEMSTKDFVIPESDLSGGTGANFIVSWESKTKTSAPIAEAVMIGSIGTRAFSFSSRGKEVEAH